MTDKEFNLINEAWIKIATQDSSVKEVNLLDVLTKAHEYRSLAGEMAAQDIAILRFLVALIHTIITRYDTNSKESYVELKEDCIERWRCFWELGYFPSELVNKYLVRWQERFWLFHPDRPFYQVPRAINGTKNTVSKLNGAVSESNNKARLFSQISGIAKEKMSYSESARWLLFLNGFDDCAAKQADKSNGSRGSTIAWLGKLGIIHAIGNNLFETIMLNMPMIIEKDDSPWKQDIPTWELENVRSSERETIDMPDNLAGLYTLQSRRIILKREANYVTGYSLLGGDSFEDKNALNEPMTLWKLDEDSKTKVQYYKPLLHRRERYIWRDFSAITAAESSVIRPGVVSWCELLRKKRILPAKRLLILGVICVRYDSSQSSSITDSFADNVQFHADLLSEAGKSWRKEIQEQISKIEDAASYLGFLVADLRRADGLNPKEDDGPKAVAKERFFNEVDLDFRDWLTRLNSEQDNEERNTLAIELETLVKNVALSIGKELVNQTGDSTFIGRSVELKNKVNMHYSSPEAYRRFKNKIWKLYSNMKGDEASEK